jgi:hypothetical protein
VFISRLGASVNHDLGDTEQLVKHAGLSQAPVEVKSRLYVGLLKTMIRGGKKFTHCGNETND